MDYTQFVAQLAARYGLSVEMTNRVGVAFWTPGDPLAKVIRTGLTEEGKGNEMSDWLDYAKRHDLSKWLKEREGEGSTQVPSSE